MAQLDILITNNAGGRGSTPNANGNPANQPATTGGNTATAATRDTSVKQTMASVYAHRVFSIATSTAKSIARFSISQYGDMTGDYLGQKKIDNAISNAETLISIGSSTIMGAMAGGWVGALFGLATSAISAGVNSWQASVQIEKNITRANNAANYNAQRIGSILVNGNRG